MLASRIYPSDGPRVNDSRGEALVWHALQKHLPQGWAAYHSLRLRSRQGVEGEGDFVIAVPERGSLLLEVKGGRIEVRDGRWLQNGYEMKRPPRAQAHSFGKLLLRVLGERDIWLPSWGIATCFPETEFDTPPGQGDLQGTVLGANDLAWLRDALPAIVDRAFSKTDSRAKGDWLAAIHELWCETWTPSLSLGTRAKVDDANRRRRSRQRQDARRP
jgi:hypothetical protein